MQRAKHTIQINMSTMMTIPKLDHFHAMIQGWPIGRSGISLGPRTCLEDRSTCFGRVGYKCIMIRSWESSNTLALCHGDNCCSWERRGIKLSKVMSSVSRHFYLLVMLLPGQADDSVHNSSEDSGLVMERYSARTWQRTRLKQW